jgi:hypothetical protein
MVDVLAGCINNEYEPEMKAVMTSTSLLEVFNKKLG